MGLCAGGLRFESGFVHFFFSQRNLADNRPIMDTRYEARTFSGDAGESCEYALECVPDVYMGMLTRVGRFSPMRA